MPNAKIRRAILGASLGALALSALPAQAQEALDALKEQGFARIAIANEPPFTAVNPDGSVSGRRRMSRAPSSSGSASTTWLPRSPSMGR